MIKELSDLGKRNRKEKESDGKIIHDAIKDEPISYDLVITKDGEFIKFDEVDKIMRPAEAIKAKKGKARLLLDKAEEVLCFIPEILDESDKEKILKATNFKHDLFMEKLKEYEELEILKPVFKFYEKEANLKKAREKFLTFPEKLRGGNIAFRLDGSSKRIHEEQKVYETIIRKFNQAQKKSLAKTSIKCSVCGASDFPVEDTPHGMIKGVPKGNPAGSAFISYNMDVFESYGLKGNLNSSICFNCATTYVEGLNWLLSNGHLQTSEKGKEFFKPSNRKNFGKDTAMVYWLREGNDFSSFDLLELPNESDINNLIDSISSGKQQGVQINTNQFYSFTLSGADGRIMVRDWMEVSLQELQKNIAQWFQNIRIGEFNYTENKMKSYYARLYSLAASVQNKNESNDVTISRVAVLLWKAALSGTIVPLWVMSTILKRIKVEENGITPERISLIRLIINQYLKGGEHKMKENLDFENNSTAYVCGRIFCVLENIQRAALGKTNAGIRERFFSSASTTPSAAFGRLMKMAQNHLSKLNGDKPGLAIVFDKELQDLFSKINSFPVLFSLEDQGRFSIGYYHQKQETFRKAAENKELKEAVEETI